MAGEVPGAARCDRRPAELHIRNRPPVAESQPGVSCLHPSRPQAGLLALVRTHARTYARTHTHTHTHTHTIRSSYPSLAMCWPSRSSCVCVCVCGCVTSRVRAQGIKIKLRPLGFTGFKLDELTPNKTRRAQCVNWLLFYRCVSVCVCVLTVNFQLDEPLLPVCARAGACSYTPILRLPLLL